MTPLLDQEESAAVEAVFSFIDAFETSACPTPLLLSNDSNDEQQLSDSTVEPLLDVMQSPDMFEMLDQNQDLSWDSCMQDTDILSATDSLGMTLNEELQYERRPLPDTSLKQSYIKRPRIAVTKAKTLQHNPNRARDERRKELRGLRVEAAELKTQLEALRAVRRTIAEQNLHNAATVRPRGCFDIGRQIWMTTAQRQFAERVASVQENKRLNALVNANADVISKLQNILRQCSQDKFSSSLDPEISLRLHNFDTEALLTADFNQLLANTDERYRKVDSVFSHCVVDLGALSSCTIPEMRADGEGNLFSQVFGTKIFPFHAQKTGRAVWDVVSDCVRPNSRCLFNHILYSTEDVVVESCGTELLMEDSKALLFHTRQIKRRYREESRDVIVWQSEVRPILFGGKPLQGAAFEESGFFLVHCSPMIPDEFSLLQTSYAITPRTRMRQFPTSPLPRSVAEFVLKWMAASIPANHQIFENALVSQKASG